MFGQTNSIMPFNTPVILIYIYWLIIAAIHIVFAIGVYKDAERLEKELNRPILFVPVEMWAIATLVGGVITAGIYWVIHHSTLRPADTKG